MILVSAVGSCDFAGGPVGEDSMILAAQFL